jgi:hypothetical protein
LEGKVAEVIDSSQMQWYAPPAGHRDAGVEFKPLFTGEEGQPGNYWFTLVQVRESYHTPAHRHMFDQVRFMLKGGFNFGPQEQPEGTVGYFTEGTTYEQSCDNYSYHLLLQCEGGSRSRYFSGRSMRGATDALKQQGEFVHGRYRYPDGREVDGYEAIYHHMTGEFPSYTEPRYERPIIIDPARFGWVNNPEQPGVAWRPLGSFNERQLTLRMVRLDAGATVHLDGGQPGLLGFVTSGSGRVGETPWEEGSGVRIVAGDNADLIATTESEIFFIDMPLP